MAHRIEVFSKNSDAKEGVKRKKIEGAGFSGRITDVKSSDVYTIDTTFHLTHLNDISIALTNPVFQVSAFANHRQLKDFDYAIEIGFLPGVTDNVGNTARESIEDLTGTIFTGQGVYSSQIMYVSGKGLGFEDAQRIGEVFANPLIERILVKSQESFMRDLGMGINVPKVIITDKPKASLVDILDANDEVLTIIGKKGIANEDGTRRGPLALDLQYMHTIKDYFTKQSRNPTDVEVESLAQTWSEHCKHTIFADPIDDIVDGLYKHYIQRATKEIRQAKGNKDFCVSVFTDNAGAIVFNENYLIAHKVETHNSPSALDPYGGSITGIVGVNRDEIGFGLGAKPVINTFGFCFADPNDVSPLYKGEGKTQEMLSSRRIMDGVIEGVNVGGNCSGIPTPQGFVHFDNRYKGKPLVFVGTVGLIPKKSKGRLSHKKAALVGDYIVMVGGRVGKDGIHGATFSSEGLDAGSPSTAVQIGNPFTQKKMSDALVKEARDLGLYNSITDNGAGGLSCSVAEMAKESGGCYVELDNVPLKYPGLNPWEIWISESQERMTLSVPPEKWKDFHNLMERRGVEATVIGEFTNSGNCVVNYERKNVMNIDMDFLHNGLPARPMTTTFTRAIHEEPDIPLLDDLTDSLHSMLKRLNNTSFEFISQQYDHEVQGGSVIKPIQGRGRVNGDATVTRPVLDSNNGVVISQGINPSYGDIDTYDMAACAMDTAVRNAVVTGADLETLALLDNFCWCSSNDKERLGQLKRSVEACYDVAVAYQTPFISGKDSMWNDFNGYDEKGDPVKISIPPTLLVSSVGVMQDARKSISLDAKVSGDYVYVLGVTKDELGGSEYFSMKGEEERGERYIGNNVPVVDTEINKKLYNTYSNAVENGLIASGQSVGIGGLGMALAKTAMGGRLGIEINIPEILTHASRDDYTIFSESQGRIVVTIDPKKADQFEKTMGKVMYSRIGIVREDQRFIVNGDNNTLVDTDVRSMLQSYKSTFKEY